MPKRISEAIVKPLGQPGTLLGQEAGIRLIAYRIVNVNFIVRDVVITNDDQLRTLLHQLVYPVVKFIQKFHFECLPHIARRAGREVAIEHRPVAKIRAENAPFGVVFCNAATLDHLVRFLAREGRYAAVALLFRRVGKGFVTQFRKQIGINLLRLRFGFLDADDVKIVITHPVVEALFQRCADAVQIVRNDFFRHSAKVSILTENFVDLSMNTQRPIPIFPVLLVNFIGMLGYSIVVPILVFLVQKFGGNEVIYGLLGSIYPAFQLIGAPLLGRWSDDIGRKRVLLISQVGTFLAWGLFITALFLPRTALFSVESDWLGAFFVSMPLICLFIARALDGLTGGNVSVANAYLSDISTDANRKANFGKMASSTSLGFIIGPALASVLGATVYEELPPVIAAALISLVAIFVIWRYLPESRQELVKPNLEGFKLHKLFQIEHKECYEMDDCVDLRFRALIKLPLIPTLFGIYFLVFFGFSFFYAGFPVFASNYLEWTPVRLGMFFTVSSAVMVVVQGPVLSYLSDKVDDVYLVLVGSLLLGSNFLLMPLGTDFWVYTAVVLLSIGNGLMWPSFLSILSQAGSPVIQGTIQGYASSMGSLASIFGLIFGGLLFGAVGPQIFYIAAVMMGLVFLLTLRLWSQGRAEVAVG